MATLAINFTIPDGTVAAIKDDFSAHLGWTATIPNPASPGQMMANPESQNAFIKRKLGEYVREIVVARRSVVAHDAATAAAAASATTDIVIT